MRGSKTCSLNQYQEAHRQCARSKWVRKIRFDAHVLKFNQKRKKSEWKKRENKGKEQKRTSSSLRAISLRRPVNLRCHLPAPTNSSHGLASRFSSLGSESSYGLGCKVYRGLGHSLGSRVSDLGSRVSGLGSRVWGLGSSVCLGPRVGGLGSRA
eukprot:3145240-Rhodomonas_salina.1